jgi:quinol monooxygenase YgiN
MTVRVIAHMTIKDPADRPAFRKYVDQIIAAVRRGEKDGTRVFEYHATGPDALSFLVVEEYADAAAQMAHTANMDKNRTPILDIATLDWAYVTGDLPPDLSAKLTAGGVLRHLPHTYVKI